MSPTLTNFSLSPSPLPKDLLRPCAAVIFPGTSSFSTPCVAARLRFLWNEANKISLTLINPILPSQAFKLASLQQSFNLRLSRLLSLKLKNCSLPFHCLTCWSGRLSSTMFGQLLSTTDLIKAAQNFSQKGLFIEGPSPPQPPR